MAALTITAANVAPGGSDTVQSSSLLQAGESMTQGQPAYKAANGKWYKADSNASAETAGSITKPVIVASAVATDGYFNAFQGGPVNLGATLTQAQIYCIGATAGSIVPYSDLTTGDYVTILGVASSSSLLAMNVIVTGIAKP